MFHHRSFTVPPTSNRPSPLTVTLLMLNAQWCIEASELSAALGYAKPRELRTNRTLNALVRTNYIFLKRGAQTTSYFEFYQKHTGAAHVSEQAQALKGPELIFFTPEGIRRLCERCIRKEDVNAFLTAYEKTVATAEGVETQVEEEPEESSSQFPESHVVEKLILDKGSNDDPSEYQVLQTLLEQLQTLENPKLQRLAIQAALVALGSNWEHKLNYLLPPSPKIELEKASPPKEVQTSEVKVVPTNRNFITAKGEFYTPETIGTIAGGYTVRQSNQAINIVARRRGIEPSLLREKTLGFNKLVSVVINGRERIVARFNADFSNEVANELNNNPLFRPPKPRDMAPRVHSF